MALSAYVVITMATVLCSSSSSIAALKTGSHQYDACAMCECSDRARVVNCTGLSLHGGLNVHYPSKMQVLILNNNNYTYLDEGEFENVPELVTLKLQSNYIKAVHHDAFRGLSNLRQLYLCSNLIEALPEGVFTPTGNLTYLSLQYNTISIQALGTSLQSAPNLQTLDLAGLSMGFSEEYALPVGFQTLTHLRTLYLEESISHLPAQIFSSLQNASVVYLSLARSHLSNISSDVFLSLPHLQQLELSRTALTASSAEVIFEAVAKANISLEVLNLRHNFIQDDEEDDNVLQPETFENLENASVHYLHLEKSWAGFQGHIQRHFFKYTPELRELYLDGSRLNNIHGQAFKDLHDLKVLSLADNYLHCFTGCSFLVTHRFHKLERLDLSNNVISDQANDFRFKNFPLLEVLNLENNKIETLHIEIFVDLKHLRRLDLSLNPLKTVEAGAFMQLHHLQYLRITDCPLLESLPGGAFRGLRSLRTLTLNNNNLMTLGRKSLDGLNNLESLSMRNNQLGQRHRVNYTSFPFHSTALTLLDLGENELDEIPYGIIAKQPQLSIVYLDHNRISHVNPDMVRMLSSVTLLDLSYNEVLYLNKDVFKMGAFPNLRTISFAGNPLVCDCSMETFLQWMADARGKGLVNVIGEDRHVCHGPLSEYGTNLFEYEPTHWQCHVKLYVVPLLSLTATVFVTCAIVCACKRRSRDGDDDHDHDQRDEYTEDMETAEETGSLTQMNGHTTHVVEAQASSSVDSSQSSITGLCLPLHSFRRKGKRDAEHEGNGHVLLESDDSDPEDTIVEDAVV